MQKNVIISKELLKNHEKKAESEDKKRDFQQLLTKAVRKINLGSKPRRWSSFYDHTGQDQDKMVEKCVSAEDISSSSVSGVLGCSTFCQKK